MASEQTITNPDFLSSGVTSGTYSNTTPSNTSSTPSIGGSTTSPQAAVAQWSSTTEFRARLLVPSTYIQSDQLSSGPDSVIYNNGGILFPYTPTITYENRAEYTSQQPTHSNYQQFFYKGSSVGPITVEAIFTAQNEYEACVILGTIHLLRALSKMPFGSDPQAGSPPPICRFYSYGSYMMENVPVSLASWSHSLPNDVDYIAVGKSQSYPTYGQALVPTKITFSLSFNLMYSRQEMMNFNVSNWLAGTLNSSGYI